MSRRNKLKKFADIFSFSNVYENFDSKTPKLTDREGRVMDIRGRWAQDHFGTANPIIAELACGYGEYTLELARRHPERHFIGVDIKGARIWQGARRALEEELRNVAFLRCRVEHLDHFFASGELQEIWITFPDPFPRDSRARRRLTAPHFLELYRRLLAPSGLVHLKSSTNTPCANWPNAPARMWHTTSTISMPATRPFPSWTSRRTTSVCTWVWGKLSNTFVFVGAKRGATRSGNNRA
jgi:tRNA (guanine-N7-)-methyltransferase